MARLAVSIVSPPGYRHAGAFAEVGELLLHGLRALGHDAVATHDVRPAGRRAVVLGSNLLPAAGVAPERDAILYNLEQIDPGSPWLGPELLDLFRRHEVWDYSPRNAARYPALGLPPPRIVPVGYVPALTRIAPAPEEDIDVLFYGSLNERRSRILDALRARGLRVESPFGVYGEERDRLVARAKVVLNVHYYEAKVFEIVRVSYLLANRRCVVSEVGADAAEERPFAEGIAFAPYEGLVETCVRLAADRAARARLAEAGFQVMSRRDEAGYLRAALGPASPPREPPGAPGDPPLPRYYFHARPELTRLVDVAGRRVLEVGCAAGAMGAALLEKGALEVVGLDLCEPALAHARSRLSAVHRVDLDTLPELPYPEGHFDLITFADVLEHLVDPAAVLRHLRRWLRDEGLVLVSIPNVRHASVVLPLLVEGRWEYADAGILDRTHLRFFTRDGVVALLEAGGFALHGSLAGVRAAAVPPAAERVAELVKALGGDALRFLEDAGVVQFVAFGRPKERRASRDPWAGSRPSRVLLVPEIGSEEDCWASALPALARSAAAGAGVTLGVAVPEELLESPPAAVTSIAGTPGLDLLLTGAPRTLPGWEALLRGTTVLVLTSFQPELTELARSLGVEVHDVRRDAGLGPPPTP